MRPSRVRRSAGAGAAAGRADLVGQAVARPGHLTGAVTGPAAWSTHPGSPPLAPMGPAACRVSRPGGRGGGRGRRPSRRPARPWRLAVKGEEGRSCRPSAAARRAADKFGPALDGEEGRAKPGREAQTGTAPAAGRHRVPPKGGMKVAAAGVLPVFGRCWSIVDTRPVRAVRSGAHKRGAGSASWRRPGTPVRRRAV